MELEELFQQKAELERRIASLQQERLNEGIAKAKALIAAYGLTAEQIFEERASERADARRNDSSRVAPKYRDPVSGNTWSGRGLTPKWLSGKDKNEYLIK